MALNHCPPGPKVSRLEGFLLATRRRDPLNFLQRIAREYGDISHFQIGSRRIFLLNHPDYIKSAISRQDAHFSKTLRERQDNHFLGNGLITSEGEYHHQQRQLIKPLFQRQKIAAYVPVILEHGMRLRERWTENETLDFAQEMKRLALGIISRVLLDTRTDAQADEIGEAVTQVLSYFKPFGVPFGALLAKLRVAGTNRPRKAEASLNALIQKIITEHRRSDEDHRDILSLLLRMENQDGHRMTDAQLRDEVMTLFLAGHESLANALAWTWYLLARHPEAQAKLHAELDAVLGSQPPTFSDLAKLRYTAMVFAETLRLYPPAWTLARFVKKDFEVGGYVLPTGSVVLLSQYVMHHDPRYFPEPSRFEPLRWTPEAIAARPQYSYFPFGGGERRCIGENFALVEGVLLIATLAQHWRVQLVSPAQADPEPVITLRPKHQLRLSVKRREAAAQLPAIVSHQACRATAGVSA